MKNGAALLCWLCSGLVQNASSQAARGADDLWSYARERTNDHRFSVYFDVPDDTNYNSNRIGAAIAWCRTNGITKVYLESYRGTNHVPRNLIIPAREDFKKAGFEVSGAITTDLIETDKRSMVDCYTSPDNQTKVADIFSHTASLFDDIIIDDFYFTKCECALCSRSRMTGEFRAGRGVFKTGGERVWGRFRMDLLYHVAQTSILRPARETKPGVKITIKYPKWYDDYQDRGYDVVRETDAFDRIWVGTETRDFDDCHYGGTPQYAAYFLMRWLGEIGGAKTGGGWYDWLATSPATYVEQARQTILGGARESVLWCYGGLQITSDPNGCPVSHTNNVQESVRALRSKMRELLTVASEVRARNPVGVAAYKPVNSASTVANEKEIFSFVGMLGIPLAPCHTFPTNAPAAFFSTHALKDPTFPEAMGTFIKSGKPVLITDGLKAALSSMPQINAQNVLVLPTGTTGTNAASLFQLKVGQLDALRAPLLRPFKTRFSAPARVAMYLFDDGSEVLENFNDTNVVANLNGSLVNLVARDWRLDFKPLAPGKVRLVP